MVAQGFLRSGSLFVSKLVTKTTASSGNENRFRSGRMVSGRTSGSRPPITDGPESVNSNAERMDSDAAMTTSTASYAGTQLGGRIGNSQNGMATLRRFRRTKSFEFSRIVRSTSGADSTRRSTA